MNGSTDFPDPTIVAVNGVELEVFEAGQQHAGNPIVLCHGWPGHAFSWRHQMSALVDAGYHVIVPNQRGYGNSSCPTQVSGYDIEHLTGDLVGLLDHYGYADATFVGHDWGATVVWGLALLHPERVTDLIALSVPYQERGDQPWIEWMEAVFGPDFYFVHFNRQPGRCGAEARALRARCRCGHAAVWPLDPGGATRPDQSDHPGLARACPSRLMRPAGSAHGAVTPTALGARTHRLSRSPLLRVDRLDQPTPGCRSEPVGRRCRAARDPIVRGCRRRRCQRRRRPERP
jgi:pimeloyl-ACP methyl ester carboxylesterase